MSLHLQQCLACLVRHISMVFEMRGWWPYSFYFMRCCFQDLFSVSCSIPVQFLCSFFSIHSYLASMRCIHIVELTRSLLGKIVLFNLIYFFYSVWIPYERKRIDSTPCVRKPLIDVIFSRWDAALEVFDSIAAVLQGVIYQHHIFIFCLDYVFRMLIYLRKENGKKMSEVSAETIADAGYADDLAGLANSPSQVKSFLHSFEQATEGIGFCVNTNKADFMRFKQGAIST